MQRSGSLLFRPLMVAAAGSLAHRGEAWGGLTKTHLFPRSLERAIAGFSHHHHPHYDHHQHPLRVCRTRGVRLPRRSNRNRTASGHRSSSLRLEHPSNRYTDVEEVENIEIVKGVSFLSDPIQERRPPNRSPLMFVRNAANGVSQSTDSERTRTLSNIEL